MRTVPATLVLLAAGCAPIPPERAERDRVLMGAIEPCKKQYPAIRDVEFDEQGRLWAEMPNSVYFRDWDGFKRCAQEALKGVRPETRERSH
jgi:hypothetical protein